MSWAFPKSRTTARSYMTDTFLLQSRESATSYHRVFQKAKQLVTHDIAQPRQGWITVCIMSYLVYPERTQGGKEKEKGEPKRCFQIFGTSAVGR